MTSSIFTRKYEIFKELLIEHRKRAGLTQQNLAELIDKPQSYISKYESGERRIDLVEFIDLAEALQFDKYEFIKDLEERASK